MIDSLGRYGEMTSESIEPEDSDPHLNLTSSPISPLSQSAMALTLLSLTCFVFSYISVTEPQSDGLANATTAWRRMGYLPSICLGLGIASTFVLAHDRAMKPRLILFLSTLWAIMMGMGHQIGLGTPIGSDGWYFVELTSRFHEFGLSSTPDGYLLRPGAMVVMLVLSQLPFLTLPLTASILGLLIGTYTTYLVLEYILDSAPDVKSFLPLIAVCWSLVVTTTGDLFDYEAHALAVLGLFFFWYKTPQRTHFVMGIVIMAALCMTHMFIPLVLILSLLIQWILDGKKYNRDMALAGILLWSTWSMLFAYDSTASTLFSFLDQTPSRLVFSSLVFVLLIAILLVEKVVALPVIQNRNPRFMSHSAIFITVFAFLPLFFIKDVTLGANFSFTKRIFLYIFAPLVVSLAPIVSSFSESLPKPSEPSLLSPMVAAMILVTSLAGGIIHHKWVGRDLYFNPQTADCWDLLAEHDMQASERIVHRFLVVHSPQLVPPEDTRYAYFYYSPGNLSGNQPDEVAIVLETPDIAQRIESSGLNGTLGYQNWAMIDQIDSVCRLWSHPEYLTERAELST